MKFPVAATLLLGSSLSVLGQQTANPSYTHPSDNATFGNQKTPKKEKAPTSRIVSGQVTDETGQPISGAMVTLTDGKTREKTTKYRRATRIVPVTNGL